MGYEIAGGLGVKMADPDREVIVMVGDGSYLMMNSEIATSVMLGLQAHHRGARQSRLSAASTACSARPAARASTTCCSTPTTRRCRRSISPPMRRASAPGREGRRASPSWKTRLKQARSAERTHASSSSTPIPLASTEAGGHWWDVAVPEVSERDEVQDGAQELRGGPAPRSGVGD